MTQTQELKIDTNSKIVPKRDIIFKKLFGSTGNEAILKDLLEAILNIKIDSLTVDLNKEMIPENVEGKRSLLDVRAELADKTQINIEMQLKEKEFLEDRVLKYAVNMLNNTILKGESYKKINKTICIWILGEDHFKENDKYHTRWTFKEDEADKFGPHMEKLEFHFIELNKLKKADIINPSKLDYWMWFIDYTDKERIKMAYENAEQVKKALDKLRELSADKALVDLMNSQDMYECDQISLIEEEKEQSFNAGHEKGFEQGIEQGGLIKQKEFAIKLKKKNIPIEEIIELTCLTEAEIEALEI